MDTMCTCRERHVESIVDQHARARAVNGVDAGRYQTRQRAALEIALTNLNEVDPVQRRGAHATDQRVFPRRAKPTAIGHQAEDRSQSGKVEKWKSGKVSISTSLLFHLFVAAKREGSSLGVSGEQDRSQLGEAGDEIDHAEARDRAADEV